MVQRLVIMVVLTSTTNVLATVNEPDILLTYRSEHRGKPPMRFYICDLRLKNNREAPIWIIHPWMASNRLPQNGLIKVSFWQPLLFGGDGFELRDGYWPANPENKGTLVRICSLAGEQSSDHFYAIRLPAGAEFAFDGYSFDARKQVDEIEFWEASDITINGTVSLADWVPYAVTASHEVKIVGRTQPSNMNFDNKTFKTRTDLRKTPVKTIQIEALSRRVVSIRSRKEAESQKAGNETPTAVRE